VHSVWTLKQAVEVVTEDDRSISRKIKRGVCRMKKLRDVGAYTILFNTQGS
jgi:hypothetical protein